jgi:type IV pilus assembly protein PilZ
MGEPNRHRLAKIITRRHLVCPRCKTEIPEEHFQSSPSQEAQCPGCNMNMRLPGAEKQAEVHDNERREKRCPVSLQVKYGSGQEFKLDYTKNVSQGGMFIKTDNPPEIGTKIHLQLHIPELNEPVLLYGEVVHRHKYASSDEDAGIGVKFLDIDPISQGILVNYIKTLSDCS